MKFRTKKNTKKWNLNSSFLVLAIIWLQHKSSNKKIIMAFDNFVQPTIPLFDDYYDHLSMLMENF